MSLIRIRYNGERFPRTINLRGHKTKTFQPDKREIEFEAYDAYLMLRNNARLKVDGWEFNVTGVVEEIKGQDTEKEAEIKAETPISALKTEKKDKDMPKRGRPRK